MTDRRLERLTQAAASGTKLRQFQALPTVSPPHERRVRIVAAGFLLALAAWGFFGRIGHAVSAPGVLVEPGPRHALVALEPGRLLEVLVSPGDRVEALDPVVRMSIPARDREVMALRRQVELLEREGVSENARLAATRVALLATEARRASEETIRTEVGGEIAALGFAPGDAVSTGGIVAWVREADARPLHAVLRVPAAIAEPLRTGMEATVELAGLDGSERKLRGEVVSVFPGPLPEWLRTISPATGPSLHRVEVRLLDPADLSELSGRACRVRIALGERSPFTLLVRDFF